MNRVGECVGVDACGLSPRRGDSAPPMTVIRGETRLSASYVVARSFSYAVGATLRLPRNCGSQKRLRLGSFPTMKRWTVGSARASDAVKAANCRRARAVRGVVRLPGWKTER